MDVVENALRISALSSEAAATMPLLWRACWQGGLLILAVWLLTRPGLRLPTALRSRLWWLACLKMLTALAWMAPVRLPLLTPASRPAVVSFLPGTSSAPLSGAQIITPLPQILRQPAAAPYATLASFTLGRAGMPRRLIWLVCILLLWVAGVLYGLVVAGMQLHRLRCLLRQANPITDATLIAQAQEVASLLRLRRLPRLLQSEGEAGTFVAGLWHPILAMNRAQTESLSEEERLALMAHELAHLKRGDLWFTLLPALTEILFWFHPLARLACREYYLSSEAACDALAVQATRTAPDEYGRLLLKLGTRPSAPHTAMALGVSPNFVTLKRRIVMLQHTTPVSRRRLLATGSLLAVSGLVTLVPWKLVSAAPNTAPASRQSAALKSLFNPGSGRDWTPAPWNS